MTTQAPTGHGKGNGSAPDPSQMIEDETFSLVMQEKMREKIRRSTVNTLMAGFALSFVAHPFTVIHSTMQMAVPAHRIVAKDQSTPEKAKVQEEAKKLESSGNKNQLVKGAKKGQLSQVQLRKANLMKMSGVTGTDLPYRAPIYTTYRQALGGLMRQGLLGFYKGNLLSIMHMITNLKAKEKGWELTTMFPAMSQFQAFGPLVSLTFGTSMSILADFLSHPLSTLQARFMLQNRIPKFSTYRSLFSGLRTCRFELFNGLLASVPRNIALTTGVLCCVGDPGSIHSIFSMGLIGGTLSYPFLTAQRRLQCQSSHVNMIRKRYNGTFHALRLIRQEEGLKGLFRGYGAFVVACGIWCTLPIFSSLMGELSEYSHYMQRERKKAVRKEVTTEMNKARREAQKSQNEQDKEGYM